MLRCSQAKTFNRFNLIFSHWVSLRTTAKIRSPVSLGRTVFDLVIKPDLDTGQNTWISRFQATKRACF